MKCVRLLELVLVFSFAVWARGQESEPNGLRRAIVEGLPIQYSEGLVVSNAAGEAASFVQPRVTKVAPLEIYVSTEGSHVHPYTNWATAATNIQAAVDVGANGTTVWVSNGMYTLTMPIELTNAITLSSVNGASNTMVDGAHTTSCIRVRHPQARILGLTIQRGAAWAPGAGVYLEQGGLIQDCVVVSNRSFQELWAATNTGVGGGIYAGPGATVAHCRIGWNIAGLAGGGVFASGAVVRACTLNRNFAEGSGGGISACSRSWVENCIVTGNLATQDHFDGGSYGIGGGIELLGSTARNCVVFRNYSGCVGGGMACINGSAAENCTVMENTAVSKSASSYFSGVGGGVCSWESDVRNCIILNNSMGPVLLAGDDEIINCAGSGFVHCCSSPLLNGLGNVAGDPGFVHVAQTNFNLTMGSPCLDAGMNLSWMDSAFDFAGAARINHGIVDIGAYEYDFDSGSLRGALRADRTKGVTPLQVELRALIAGVGTEPLLYRWDFDGDGIVDREGYDLMAVSYEYPQPGHYSASLTLSQGLGAPVVISNLSLYSAPAFIHVSPSGQNTFPFTNWIMAATNIQTAVDVGVSGSRVLVTGGLYRIASSIRVTNGIWLCGMNGAASTLVEGVYSNRCFYLNHTGAVLEGFTIRKGYEKYEDGGGVLCKSGMVKRCILVDNQADWGGGIYLMGGRAEDCLVYSNAARCGGGIYFRYDGVGQNCLVYGNRAAYGGGVYCFNGGRVQNCTISGNWATNGGGLATYHGGAAANTILTGNYGSNGLNYFIEGYPAAWSYCCAYPLLSGAGSLNADPQFVDATARDYHLQAGSPCVDAGHTEVFPSFDLDGLPRPLDGHADGAPRCDIGCYEFMHALADSDGDELVDANELAMGSSPTLWDSDADGSGDGDERIAGTDACDGQSVFALRAGESSPGEDSIIRWPSAPGRTYTLSRTTNLLNGFSVLAVDLPATPPENCYTDAVMQSGFQAYQVKVHE